MTESAINISTVNKRFGSTHAVRDLDLEVPMGSVCGFLGPNGAGKSTTIRMIMSIIYPDTGSIDVLGSSALKNKDRIGYLPEERGLYRKMRVGDFLEYITQLKGYRPPELKAYLQNWLERLDLADVYRKRCQELSKGMQQKIQFLASIVHEPELIILDEPFSGLDPVNAELVNGLIKEQRDAGRTIIFSTHVLHQAEQICDRIFLINKGVKLLDASMSDIREGFDPRTLLVESANGHIDLTDLPGVSAVHEGPTPDTRELELGSDADPHAIMRAVLERGPVRSVAQRRLTLEEVFIRLVAEGSGAHAAELAREELSHV